MRSILHPLLRGVALSSVLFTCVLGQGESTTCGEEDCQPLVQMAIAYEHESHAHPSLDDFYSIPDTFNASLEPGSLLRVEQHTDLTNYTVPSGLTLSRIMYTSLSLNGTVVPASAFVLWPYAPFDYYGANQTHRRSNATSSKFPVVAWAHGTSGVFSECAPSNYRSLQYQFMTSYSLALNGFAVVATDYAGLGVTTLPNGEQSHNWLASPAGANDVAYAMEAARKAFPENLESDGPFVAMGHSQGGGVAWSFAERQAKHPQAGYRGTIAISPSTRVIDEIDRAQELVASTDPEDIASLPLWAPTALGLAVKIIASITTVYPEYNDTGLTDISYDRWHNVLKPLQACLPTDSVSFLFEEPQAKPNWTQNAIVQEWQEATYASGKEIRGPLLVLVGGEDAIPVDMLEDDVDSTCAAPGNEKESVELISYAGAEHFPVIQASQSKWMDWIKERVTRGEGVHEKGRACGKKSVVQGFNNKYTAHGITPNWLVSWAPQQEAWKYAL